jgi:hypothetical protein
MVVKLEHPVTAVMELAEYKEFVDTNVDFLDYDSVCETAWALKALANNRRFLGQEISRQLKSYLDGRPFKGDTPYSIIFVNGSCWVPGWWIVSSNNRRHEGAKQGLAALTGVVHELKETKIQRQLVLRDTPVRPQPGAQQRPEALNCIDMNFAQSIAIIVARILAMGVADRLVAVAPGWQPGVDVVFISVDQRAGCNRLRDDRLDGCLLHVGQHMQDDAPAALDQAKDWRFLLFQRAASRRACKPATTSRAPLFTTSAGWPLCPATM